MSVSHPKCGAAVLALIFLLLGLSGSISGAGQEMAGANDHKNILPEKESCLLYTSDAADE